MAYIRAYIRVQYIVKYIVKSHDLVSSPGKQLVQLK